MFWVEKITLEEGMATHSSVPSWRMPWTEEAGGLQSMGSQRVSHDRSDLACVHIGTFLAVQWLRLHFHCRACRFDS